MVTNAREQHFPESTGSHRDGVDRDEVQRADQEVVIDAARVMTAPEQQQNRLAPAGQRFQTHREHRGIGLVAGIPHADERAGRCRKHHHDHDALEVNRISNVWRAARYIRRRIKQRVDHLVHGVKAFEAATFDE